MKTILILCDTLIRNFLPVYGHKHTITPNINRLAERSTTFDNHWIGSAPCMPARRDIFTGRIEFLERPWGPLEPFDKHLSVLLRGGGIYSHIITDHYHYFELSGEGYCQKFDTWDFIRGAELDLWASTVGKRYMIRPGIDGYEKVMGERRATGHQEEYGAYSVQYELNRRRYDEEGFPCTRTFDAAVKWLEENRNADNYLLAVESFTPHEPFDAPDEYRSAYTDDYDGPDYKWPSYAKTYEPDEAVKKLRNNYMSSVAFLDSCLGKLLDKMDEYGMWENTMVILTTDHGHMLGEHNFIGKDVMPEYNEISHIPLIVHYPGSAVQGTRIGALTQNIDIFPTILEYFGVEYNHEIHGKSWIPLLKGEAAALRDTVIYGTFGKDVNITDGKYTYTRRRENDDNQPLYAYTAMPTSFTGCWNEEFFEELSAGRYLKRTRYPVYKVPVHELWLNDRYLEYCSRNMLFDLSSDYRQEINLAGSPTEEKYIQLLIEKMKEMDSPEEQFTRLGL